MKADDVMAWLVVTWMFVATAFYCVVLLMGQQINFLKSDVKEIKAKIENLVEKLHTYEAHNATEIREVHKRIRQLGEKK